MGCWFGKFVNQLLQLAIIYFMGLILLRHVGWTNYDVSVGIAITNRMNNPMNIRHQDQLYMAMGWKKLSSYENNRSKKASSIGQNLDLAVLVHGLVLHNGCDDTIC